MADTAHCNEAPGDWLDILAESEADLAACRIVPGDVVMRELRDALAPFEAKTTPAREPKTTARR